MRTLFRLIVKYYFVLLFLLLEGIALVLIAQFNPFHKSIFLSFSRNVTNGANATASSIRDYFFLREENLRLNSENAELRNKLSQGNSTVYLSYPNIGDTIGFTNHDRYSYMPAEIVKNSVTKQYNYITIRLSESDIAEPNMAVVSSEGIIGMIIETSKNFATVLPLINRNSKVGAKIKGNDYFGILYWDGRNPEYIQLSEIPVHVEIGVGDTIVTSGYSSVYPKDLAIGVIEELKKGQGNFYDIQIKLFVNFRTINHVMVVNNYYQNEQIELERGIPND